MDNGKRSPFTQMPYIFEGITMSLTKILLAGAAITALSTTAFAGAHPDIHLASVQASKMIHLKNGFSHNKTRVHQDGKSHFTETLSFSLGLTFSTAHNNPILLPEYTWYNSSDCSQATKQKIKYTKPSAGKIAQASSTGSISGCTGTTFTFYGGTYTLKDKKATSDSFRGDLKGQTPSYKLSLIEGFDVSIAH